ncbi:hypothetical protein IMSAGC019_01805 [Lachnospiraceae bacterium]|nr:hypothetical protein IMSAGC019_01805 [Lachnospiraceae bacterium]
MGNVTVNKILEMGLILCPFEEPLYTKKNAYGIIS